MVPQQYCLKWKYHNTNIQSTFSQLRDKANYCDVTLWSGGAAMRAHRAVLAACSGLFAELLASHDASLGEPAIILTDSVHAHHLRHLLSFMYTGEVSVHHAELASLLKTAEELRIKGLADVSWRDQNLPLECSSGNTTEISSAPTSPSDSRIPTDSKSDENKDDEGGKRNGEKSKSGSMSVTTIPLGVNSIINGTMLMPMSIVTEPRRRRGRPPLDQKLTSSVDSSELIIQEPPAKRPKIMSSAPNILRKSRLENKNVNFVDITNWNKNIPISNPDNDNELSDGDVSDGSLDGGQDISQFLATSMEEDPTDIKLPGKPVIMMMPDNGSSEEAGPSGGPSRDLFSDVVKLSDYLLSGRRTQFWAEDYVKRVMEAVFCRELEMKQAAEILGVSYGTLYGRYRDTFGCINRPYRAREFWSENSDILAKLQRKEITFMKAAELLSITPQMLFNYVNTVTEPVINQQEASEIFSEALMKANSKSIINIASKISEGGQEQAEDSEDMMEETCALTDFLRRRVEKPLEKTDIKLEKIDNDDKSLEILDITSDTDSKENSKSSPNEPSSSNTKKLPMIRVANLKFLKGEPNNQVEVKTDMPQVTTKGFPIILKPNTPIIRPENIKMMSSKRKVTIQEIEMSLKTQANLTANRKNITTISSAKPSVT